MKIFVLLLFLGLSGGILYFGNLMRTGYRSCNVQYQDSLDTIAIQARTVFGDRRGSCLASFNVLSDWDACVAEAEKPVYRPLRMVMKPFITNVMMFFREKSKDTDILKREHDQRCNSYTELMFFPPEE